MSIKLQPVAYQHFSSSGADDVMFGGADIVGRSIRYLILTTSGTVNMSFNGNDFVALADGTHTFQVPLKRVWFTGGTWSGIGVSV